MVQTPTKPLALKEFLELPETEPASEYVDGQIIQKPMSQGEHSIIQSKLIIAIRHLTIGKCGGGDEADYRAV